VHEQDARVRIVALGRGEQCAAHVGVSPRLEHQRAAKVIVLLPHPLALVEHRLPLHLGESTHDQAERLTRRVGIDCSEREHGGFR
jgi:hypothetical protein